MNFIEKPKKKPNSFKGWWEVEISKMKDMRRRTMITNEQASYSRLKNKKQIEGEQREDGQRTTKREQRHKHNNEA